MEKTPWLERTFPSGIPVAMIPNLIERLRGTPARLSERLARVEPDVLTRREGHTWSILEVVGHLGQVEELWFGRLDDIQAGRPDLRPARFEAGRVESAGFNAMPLTAVLERFRAARLALVMRIEELDDAILRREARHPRLGQVMTLADLIYFAAEHDDHHLARISEILRAGGPSSAP